MAMRSALDHTMLGGGCKNSNCRDIIIYYTAHALTHAQCNTSTRDTCMSVLVIIEHCHVRYNFYLVLGRFLQVVHMNVHAVEIQQAT